MSEFKQKENTGSTFKNKNKKSDNSPDYTGTINVEGTEFFLSTWIKKDKNNQVYFSHSVKKKEKQIDNHSQAKADGYAKETIQVTRDLDDTIPF